MTASEFFELYQNGQRYFYRLDFENEAGFTSKNFSDIVFDQGFLFLDFQDSNFTHAKCLKCNLKEIDLSKIDLTNAILQNCLVESANFDGAIVKNFKFIDNYYFGVVISQDEFELVFINGVR